MELREEVKRLEEQIDAIAEIKECLIPQDPPEIAGVEFATSHRSQGKVGGDFFDFLPLDRDEEGKPLTSGRWAVVIADATGHGPSSAFIMVMLQSILHAFSGSVDEPTAILHYANDHMCSKVHHGLFVTATIAIIDPARSELSYSCAGHAPPLIRTADGSVVECEAAGGLPLGVMPDQSYEGVVRPLNPGETYIFYTDGLLDSLGEDGERFGLERTKDAVEAAEVNATSRSMLSSLKRAVRAHRLQVEQTDDETVVICRILPT